MVILNYILLGILAPIFVNLLHLVVGLYVVTQRGNVHSLGFTGISFFDWFQPFVYLFFDQFVIVFYRSAIVFYRLLTVCLGPAASGRHPGPMLHPFLSPL